MKRKNVIGDHSEAASNFFPVGILVVDSDQESLQENVTILQKFPQIYKVTKCDKISQDFTWLETDGSEFGIILIGECLLAANKLKLIQIGNARDLTVLVTSADGGIDTITRTIDDGACDCLPKPIPESVLERVWTYAYSKRKNKLAQMQKLTDDASREKKPRLKWTGYLKQKVVECVTEAGGIKEAKPNDILDRLRAKGIQDKSITRDKVSSYLQKGRERDDKNKEGAIEGSTLKTESNQPTERQPSVDESLDDFCNALPSLDGVNLEDSSLPSNKSFPTGMSENYTAEDDVLTMEKISEMIPSNMPGYKDKEGTSSQHVPLPVAGNTSCTGGGLPFINDFPDNFWEGLGSETIDFGALVCLLEGPSSSLPNERCPVEITKNYTGNDIAHEHSDNPLVVDDNFSVDNYSVDDDLLMPPAAGLQEGEPKG